MKHCIISFIIFLLLASMLFFLSGVLGSFICALIIAYFLHPIVSKLEKIKFPRSISTCIIIASFFLLLGAFVIYIIPLIYLQFINAITSFPTYFSFIKEHINTLLLNYGYELDAQKLQTFTNKYSDNFLTFFSNFVNNIWASTITVVNAVSLIFIIPVITFYILRDWKVIMQSVDQLIPRQYYLTIKEQLVKMDNILSAYIRGQTQVCILLGIFYSLGLYFIGLNYSLFIGFITGILSFIPYVGFALGFTFANIVSFYQFDSLTTKLLVVAVFIIGQALESAVITPKLVGKNVKLHPVWIIFAILAGGTLYGFIGVLIAVPFAAIIGVLMRFITEYYFKSNIYGAVDLNKK